MGQTALPKALNSRQAEISVTADKSLSSGLFLKLSTSAGECDTESVHSLLLCDVLRNITQECLLSLKAQEQTSRPPVADELCIPQQTQAGPSKKDAAP